MALSDRIPYQAQVDRPKLTLPGGKKLTHCIKYLEALLDYVRGHDGVALMTASEIGDWYRAEMAKC